MGLGFDVWAQRKDGSRLPVDIALAPLRVNDNRRVLAFVRDISDRHRAHLTLNEAREALEARVVAREHQLREEHAKLIQTEKLSSIGLLAAGIAHEINNPLSGVMGCVKAMKEGQVPEGRQSEYLETVEDGLARIRATVQGLLDYSRQHAFAPTSLELTDVIAAAFRLLESTAAKKQVELRGLDSLPPTTVWGDRGQLMQAVVNVVMNAIQATPTGSWVRVEVSLGDRVGIHVIDRGPGFRPEDVPRAADPFFTTKPEGEGTGLGLAVTHGIVKSHGGDMSIEKIADGGAQVTLWLNRPTAGDDVGD
jgi:signal transduction histidine kinase